MFFKTNTCIFIVVRMKAFTMQSKNKIGAWAQMRLPLSVISFPCFTVLQAQRQPDPRTDNEFLISRIIADL